MKNKNIQFLIIIAISKKNIKLVKECNLVFHKIHRNKLINLRKK